MPNEHLYKDTPYIPSRDPREINVVDKINELKNREYIRVNDDSVEYSDIPKILQSESQSGVPGSLVRLNDQGIIDPTCLPPSSGGSPVRTARTHFEFPTVGVSDVIYIATEENEGKGYIYRWCDGLHCYERPDDTLDNISEIYGGSAEGI